MSDRNPNDSPEPGSPRGARETKGPKDPTSPSRPAENLVVRALSCEEWEAMLADSSDGSLSPADSVAFDAHAAGCSACSELLSRAVQGQEWLRFLAQPPVSPDLVSRILARTSGALPTSLSHPEVAIPQPAALPFWRQGAIPASMRRMAEPRLMMTAAMAFFSIALTLNLAGVRISAIRLADLNPLSMRNNLSRQFINSKVGVENYCYNLRIVYEMEARVREMKRDSDSQEGPAPVRQQPPASSPRGSATKTGGTGGKSENPRAPEPRAALWGQSVQATMQSDPMGDGSNGQGEEISADCRQNGEQSGEQPGEQDDRQSIISSKSCVRPEKDRAIGSLA